MLSLKRLAGLLAVTLFLGTLFFIYALNDSKTSMITMGNDGAESASIMVRSDADPLPTAPPLYLIGGNTAVRRNVAVWLDRWRVPYKTATHITDEGINQEAVYIFCTPTIESMVNLETITNFVENGGRMMLAAGLSEGYGDSYITPLLGIIEKGTPLSYSKVAVEDGFLPFYESTMTYDGYASTRWLKLHEEATVYMSDADSDAPIVYEFPFGKGRTVVINTSLLEDPLSSGIFAGAYGVLEKEFAYPIMGTKAVFLDNFPIATNINDNECLRLYGRSTESFVRDRMWPTFEGIGLRAGVTFTSAVLTAVTGDLTFPRVNSSLFYDISRSTILYGGEVIFSANLPDNGAVEFYTMFEQEFRRIFPAYEIQGFSIQSGSLSDEAYDAIRAHYPDVTILRGYLSGDSSNTYLSDVDKDDLYHYPVISSGNAPDKDIWSIAMGVAGYGMLSHKYDIDTMMGISGNGSTWEENVENLSGYEKRIYNPLEWLEPRTLSGLQTHINGLAAMSYQTSIDGSNMHIFADNVVNGQPFLLRSEKRIKSATGAEYESIAKGYYLVKLTATDAVLVME